MLSDKRVTGKDRAKAENGTWARSRGTLEKESELYSNRKAAEDLKRVTGWDNFYTSNKQKLFSPIQYVLL